MSDYARSLSGSAHSASDRPTPPAPQVEHPAAKMMILSSQMQEQEVGDGTNFVLIMAGALLASAEDLLRMVRRRSPAGAVGGLWAGGTAGDRGAYKLGGLFNDYLAALLALISLRSFSNTCFIFSWKIK